MKKTLGILFIGVILTILVYFAWKEEVRWQEWASEHCEVVGKESGTVGVASGVVGGDFGVFSTYSAGKTEYKCDDGVTYKR